MSKKIWIPVIVSLLVAGVAGVWLYADAAAQGRIPLSRPRKLPGALGQVASVAADHLTLHTKAGQERTFRIDENTRFVDPDKQELSADDLQTGGWVAVAVARPLSRPPLARLVVILPEDFDPANWAGVRGRVTDVDLAGDDFTLESKDGQTSTVHVDENTKYRGQVSALDDLDEGMLAQAAIEKQANGDLLARSVRAGFPLVRHAGEVVSVDPASFTIQTRRGETITFQVTDNTRFRSRRGVISGLEDLKAGMPVAVGAEELGDGQFLAQTVIVAPNLTR